MINSIDVLKSIVSQNPADAAALGRLGDAYRNQGSIDEALDCYEKLVELQPNNYEALNNYGALLRNTGDFVKSTQILMLANSILPDNPIILTNLSLTYIDMGRCDKAVECADRAVKIQPGFYDASIMLGKAYFQSADYPSAIESFKHTLKLKPDDKEATTFLARSYYYNDDAQTAYNTLKPLIDEKFIGCATAYLEMSRKLGQYDKAGEYLESILAEHKGMDYSPTLHFLLGKYYDRNRRYDEAFLHFAKGNKLSDRECDISQTAKEFNRIAALFSRGRNKNAAVTDIASTKPVFIVGMPRTGTTLVEQILASHPQVYGAGELNNLELTLRESRLKFDKHLDDPEMVSSYSPDELNWIATQYLDYLNSVSDSEARVTDKMPHNFKYVGLIFRLFPNAYVINTLRHPLDTCLSCFFSEFGTFGHGYSYNLSNIGKYYLFYDKLMSHWIDVYGDRICRIKYKDLVLDHEATCRKMVEFCGLEWDDNCLNFHKSERKINTLSRDQVNQPIYTGSIDRWKNYEKHITALQKRLKSVINDY